MTLEELLDKQLEKLIGVVRAVDNEVKALNNKVEALKGPIYGPMLEDDE